MKYQYRLSASRNGKITNAFWFNHQFMGWVILPEEEMKNFIKTLKARYRKGTVIDTR